MKISKALVVCLTVGFLGLLAFALGLTAEIKRIKVSDVTFTSYHECTHPRSVAFALGLTASLSLIIAHVIIHVSAGSFCCCYRNTLPDPTSNRRKLSWFSCRNLTE
ncbi:uncharacterized protein LOC113304052 isoform X1 [Papaver somniferum]|uniref:uncharacterized protein LOC113304052 isoform X1 n=1 Tax=Papaver somniferum TaxID=3469 RepID=UPI000E6F68F5|nr:uncharacterized protein LOC113304052 isoform X1 [Papaver somniferum]